MEDTEATEFTQLIGLIVNLNKDGTCTSQLRLRTHHLSVAARVHGGVLASMLDTTLGGAVFGSLPVGNGCATLSFNISFFRPVAEGKLICTARVGNMTRRTAYASGEIHDEEGRLVASATGTFFLTSTAKQSSQSFAP